MPVATPLCPRLPHAGRRAGGVLFITMILLCIGAGAWGLWALTSPGATAQGADEAQDDARWHTVRREGFEVTVIATGELNAKDRVEVRSQLEPQGEVSYLLEEGTLAKKGDLLVKFIDEAIRTKIQDAKLDLEKSRESVQSAKTGLEIGQSEARSDVEAAQVKVEMADLDLKKWESGDVVQKRRELELAMEKARRSLARAQENVVLSRQLYAEEFIAKSELEDDELKLIEAQEAIKTATLDLEVHEKFTQPKDRRKYESELAQNRAELDRTRRKNESNLLKAEGVLRAANESLSIHEEKLRKLEDQLKASEVRAPSDGLVVYATSVGSRRYTRNEPIAQGTLIRFNEVVMYLPDTSRMIATLKVPEPMLRHLREGQEAVITVDAHPDKPLQGKVEFISIVAESSSWWNPSQREYAVRVDLSEHTGLDLKPGMRCTGKVLTDRITDALSVPVQSVQTLAGKHFCYTADPGGVRRVRVSIGRASETLVEITSGLSQGDRVLLRRPRPGEVVNPAEHDLTPRPAAEPEFSNGAPAASTPGAQTATPSGTQPAARTPDAAPGGSPAGNNSRGEPGAGPGEGKKTRKPRPDPDRNSGDTRASTPATGQASGRQP